MIKIEFFDGINGLCGYRAQGHAEGADAGENVLCAFVSSSCIMTANTITEVLQLDADAHTEDGYLRLMLRENAEPAQDILEGLKLHLTQLQQDYPQNIKVIYRRCNNA